MRAAASAARRPTRSSAPASCRTRAWWSARARTSAPASRTRRCTRSTRRARTRAAPRCTARSSRARTPAAPAPAPSASSPPASAASSPRWRIRFRWCSGRGFAALRAHGIEVDVGVGRDAAVRLNQPFLTAVRTGRPFVILKAATSLDGRIAAAGRADLADVAWPRCGTRSTCGRRSTRSASGRRRVLVDDPLLTAREVYRERPLARVVFDRRLRTPAVGARVLDARSRDR